MCGIQTKMPSSHHPQTDGLSEIMNRMVENYIRCYCALNQRNWDELLPSAEFAYNSAVSADLGLSPFEVDMGWKPKSLLDIIRKEASHNETVNEFKGRLEEVLQDAQFSHELAKARQSAYSACRATQHEYQEGDKLWLDKIVVFVGGY